MKHKKEDLTKALKSSPADLSLIFDNVSDSISLTKIEKDGKQRIIDVNSSFLHMTGFAKIDLIGKTLDTVVFGEDYELGKRKCVEAVKARHPIRYIREFDTPKGKATLESDLIPIFDQEDKCTHFLYVTRDTTERVRAEEALKRSEEKYSSVVESSKDGIILYEGGIIKFVNPAIMEMTGFKQDDLSGSSITDFVAPEYVELVGKRYADRAAGKDVPNIYEIKIKKSDGSELPVELNVSIMNFEGKPAALVFVRDLSRRKKAEEQIRKSLEEKEVLLREIHHRVKNNMQIMSSLLRLQSQSIKDAEALEKFAVSQSRIKSMALIHDSLYRSKDLSRVDFSDYVQILASHLTSMFGPRAERIAIKLDLDQIYLEINTAIPLGLIINELVSNSLKHAFSVEERGEIRIILRQDKTGGYSLIVKDTGAGFPEDRDFQATETLGLNIVTDLVKQLEGTINLSREGGTEFKISF
jgi:PAS domain S-box-containing protein